MATAKVLVVDDSRTILAFVSFLLSGRGPYEVFATPNPKQALEIVKSSPFIDVVVSDVEMPELRGPELLSAIMQTSPATGCVLMSASSRPEELPPDVPFLRKPIDAAELFSAVEMVLSKSIQGRAELKHTLTRAAQLRNEAIILKSELTPIKQAIDATIEESIKVLRQK